METEMHVAARPCNPRPVSLDEMREWRYLRALVARSGVPPADVDDVTQEAMIAAHKSRSSFVVPAGRAAVQARQAWLRIIVQRQVAGYRRGRARHVLLELCADPEQPSERAQEGVPSPEDNAIVAADCALALEVLDELEPDRRTVFVAYELEGDEMSEIAAELGISSNTAWNRLRLARDDVRAAARRRGQATSRCCLRGQ